MHSPSYLAALLLATTSALAQTTSITSEVTFSAPQPMEQTSPLPSTSSTYSAPRPMEETSITTVVSTSTVATGSSSTTTGGSSASSVSTSTTTEASSSIGNPVQQTGVSNEQPGGNAATMVQLDVWLAGLAGLGMGAYAFLL